MGEPSGTVTFLFSDIESSTQLWEKAPDSMRRALAEHDRILRTAVEAHQGHVFATGGDGFAVAFSRAGDALAAADEGSRQLARHQWPHDAPIRVRMAIHTGEVHERDGDYFGPPVNRAARLTATAHGGQILRSAVTASLSSGQLPEGCRLQDLGEHRLRDLSEPERVYQLIRAGEERHFPALRSLDAFPGNLPVQPTAFVGRHLELEAVRKALHESRVVTLTGVGGVGKTRLALQVAADIVPGFADGAWFVELAGVGTSEAFDDAVASALGVRQRPGTPLEQCMLEFLDGRTILLVLDNCEHLLTPVARFVARAVQGSAGVQIVATSREGLAVPGERIVTVPSLELPVAGEDSAQALTADAVRLFVERAREADARFSESEDAAAIAELCRRLDGIPLAIELAAARTRAMTPIELTEHLDRRFRLLTRGRRTATTRHQTLRNTIDWSYDLLDEEERMVFRRLAVFAGGFGLEAAEAVVAGSELDPFDVLDILGRLVEKSLLVTEPHSGSTRYRLLETLRDYGADRLGESGELDDTGRRHADFFLAFAKKAEAGMCRSDELLWRRRVEEELENLRAALTWSMAENDVDRALRLIDAFGNFGVLRIPPFGLQAAEVAGMPDAVAHPLRPVALAAAALTLTQSGFLDRALVVADEALEAADALPPSPEQLRTRCRLRSGISTPLAYSGDQARLDRLAREAVVAARAIDDEFELAQALVLFCGTAGSLDEALAAGEEALERTRRLGSLSYVSFASMMLASRLGNADPGRATELLDEAKDLAVRAGNEWAEHTAIQSLGVLYAEQGRFLEAAHTFLEMGDFLLQGRDRGGLRATVSFLAATLAVLGDEEAALLLGAWVEQWGALSRPTRAAGPAGFWTVGLDSYRRLREDQPADAWERLSRRALQFDDGGILDFVRSRLRPIPD